MKRVQLENCSENRDAQPAPFAQQIDAKQPHHQFGVSDPNGMSDHHLNSQASKLVNQNRPSSWEDFACSASFLNSPVMSTSLRQSPNLIYMYLHVHVDLCAISITSGISSLSNLSNSCGSSKGSPQILQGLPIFWSCRN